MKENIIKTKSFGFKRQLKSNWGTICTLVEMEALTIKNIVFFYFYRLLSSTTEISYLYG